MNEAAGNPSGNALRAGVTEEQLSAAIEKSGYPLQTVVAESLRPYCERLSEEWSYVDRDSGLLRAIDVRADRTYEQDDADDPHLRATLTLLVECKQSDMPYVFFLSPR